MLKPEHGKKDRIMIQSSEICTAFFLFCDIRGFSRWMRENQFEATELLDIFYTAGFEFFGERKEQKYRKRVSKLLGDGFLAVHEYDPADREGFNESLNRLIEGIAGFHGEFRRQLDSSTIHGRNQLHCAYGLSYGRGVRFNIPGYSLDYVSDRINFASRLAGVADSNEVVFEYDLWDQIDQEKVSGKKEAERDLKKIGLVKVGVYKAVS